jgi:UDP-glucose/GDP-mannose dehydrogenase family, NAD binding domain
LHTYHPATSPSVEELTRRFRDRSATVGIIGLGYVGLPLVQALLGLAVIGVDIDAGMVAPPHPRRELLRAGCPRPFPTEHRLRRTLPRRWHPDLRLSALPQFVVQSFVRTRPH